MKNRHLSRGFSVIEVVLAAALFMLFSTSAVGVVLQGFNANRLGGEETTANQFASEGIEAVKSIKNQAYSNLVNTAGTGIVRTGGVWTFTGAPPNNTLTHNSTDNYTRVIKVESVNRDGSGNIVATGGTLDPDTKKITSTVNWNFNSARPESVVLITYLSDWRKPIVTNRGGILVYGNGGTTSDAIQYKILDATAGTWGAAASAADIDAGTTNRYLRSARVFASATRNEKVLVSRHYNGTTQYIYAQVFNGTAWGNVNLLASWAATTFLDVRNFDGTYLNNGDFMVVYSDNTTTPKFKTWNGSTWSTASGVAGTATQNIGGIPNYIALRNRSGTNEAMAAFFDQSSDTNTQYFYIGSNNTYETADWTLHTKHSAVAPTNTKEHIDFAWSPQNTLKGALVYPNSSTDTTLAMKIWTANGSGGGTWSAVVDSAASGGRLGATDIDGRKGAEEFIACQKDANNDIYCFRGNTTPAWASPTNNILTTTSDTGIQRSFDLGYEATSGTQGLAVYSDNTTTAKYRKYTASTNAFDSSASSISPALGGVLKTVRTRPLIDNDDIMALMADANNDLYSVVWDGSSNAMYTTPSGKAFSTHGTNGSATTDFWYDFAWDRF